MRIKKRWGKDLNILWKVTFKDGSAFTNSMKDDLLLEARDSRNKLYIIPITSIDEAGIRAKFDGEDHGPCGHYNLTLWYLRGKNGTTCVDLPNAFDLVRYTCLESSNDLSSMDGDLIVTALDIEYGRTELNEIALSIANVKETAESNASSIRRLNLLASDLIRNKVEKENGKGLSSNDFTNKDKQQIAYNGNKINDIEESLDVLREEYEEGFTVLNGYIGNIENLETNTKLDIVSAINEIFSLINK